MSTEQDSSTASAPSAPLNVDYLVGGFRISIGAESDTPGPRTHIVSFVGALREGGHNVRLLLASDLPLMGRFARVRQSDYATASDLKVRIADVVRMGAAVWTGANVLWSLRKKPAPDLIYERVAVLQSLTSFHPAKRRAVRVVEANGILSRETAHDRKVLRAEKLAAALERHVLRRADLVVAVSAPLRDELVRFAGLDRDSVLVVPNGVSSATAARPRKVRPDEVVIGFVGSIVKWQHLDSFLETVANALPRLDTVAGGKRVVVEIIGDGAEFRTLVDVVARLDLGDRVQLLGRLPHEEALERMTEWNIGFAGHEKSTSDRMYHSPLKVYEYAALGLAAVCTYSDDANALQHSGLPTFFYSDQESLSFALEAAVLGESVVTQEAIAERRAAVARDHSWSERLGRVLNAALGAKAPRRGRG
jgi:glycosyltransferase involved in cell wall biosynthesis